MRLATSALLALVLGAATWAGQDAFPWPALASRSLAGLFVLAGVTRIFGDNGVRIQRMMRFAVAGVALTAAAWFTGGARLLDDANLLGLAGLHVLAALLAAAPTQDKHERLRGLLVLGASMTTVSLLAISVLPVGRFVAATPHVPVGLAIVVTIGAFYIARDRTGGLALTAVAGIVTLVLAARVLVEFVVHAPGSELMLGRAAPLVASTAVLGAVFPIVALAKRLPTIWAALLPNASKGARALYAWLTLPTVTLVAVTVIASL